MPAEVAAHACACRDVDGDGKCGPGDIPVDDAEWLGGAAFVDHARGFVVPETCTHVLSAAPVGGVRVTAARIVFSGSLAITPPGGAGVLFVADQDLVLTPGASIIAGGVNTLSVSLAENIAIARSSVGLKAGTTCELQGAFLRGNPTSGFGQVGIQCGGDISIAGSEIVAAGIDIQSLRGSIDASTSKLGPATSLHRCDDSRQNPNGNDNGILDDGDFPCTLTLPGGLATGRDAVNAFCAPPTSLRALNNPLIAIAAGDVNLAVPGVGTEVESRYRVTIIAENGDVNLRNATLTNAIAPAVAPGGAIITISANPASVNRLPVFRETAAGPFAGSIDVTDACFQTPNAVQFNGIVTGAPAGSGCLTGAGAGAAPLAAAGQVCDLQGNNNGVLDAGDFPCLLSFDGPVSRALVQAEGVCTGVAALPDVALSKSAAAPSVVEGGTIKYTLVVRNLTDAAASEVVVRDPLPTGTSFVSCTASQGTCTHAGGVVTATIGTLAANASVTVTLEVKAPTGAQCSVVENVATVTAKTDRDSVNNSASASTTCTRLPDVKIEKLDDPDPVVPEGSLKYTLSVRNIGGTPATNVVVTDQLPAGLTFVSCATPKGACSFAAGKVTAALGTLAAAEAVTFTINVKAPAAAACSVINNTATVKADVDADMTNNSASASTTCIQAQQAPDVKLQKLDDPDPVMPGGYLKYTLVVKNIGGMPATNVVVTDPLPAGTTFVYCTTPKGTCSLSSGTVTARLGTLAAAETVTFYIKVKAPAAGSCSVIDNTATVKADADADMSNNTASASTTCSLADVKIEKLDDPDPVTPGGYLKYTVIVKNVGGTPATNVVVTDRLPAGTTFVYCTTPKGTCSLSSGTVTARLGTLAAAETVTFYIKVKAPAAGYCSIIDNTATVKADVDADASNNSATTRTTCSGTETCPHTQGYWKNHPEAWPVSSLVLGDVSYSKSELLAIFKMPVTGDASLNLAHQLIAAKLNVAAGASSSVISSTIAQADALLAPFSGKLPYGVHSASSTGVAMVAKAGILDSYNNGNLTSSCRKD